MMRRRTYLQTVGAVATTGLLAGCSGDSDGENGDGTPSETGNDTPNETSDGTATETGDAENQVAVGPDNDFVFEPESITVSTGDTVTWTFESPGHNVECKPSESDYASMPEGAEPFASYEGDNRFAANEQGTTFEYTFEVAGSYEYVCTPHAAQGMRGTVVVEE